MTPAWESVVSDLKKHVDSEPAHSDFLDQLNVVVVEIIDPLLLEEQTVGPVLDNARLKEDWPTI